jgi:hypothetical protein
MVASSTFFIGLSRFYQNKSELLSGTFSFDLKVISDVALKARQMVINTDYSKNIILSVWSRSYLDLICQLSLEYDVKKPR